MADSNNDKAIYGGGRYGAFAFGGLGGSRKIDAPLNFILDSFLTTFVAEENVFKQGQQANPLSGTIKDDQENAQDLTNADRVNLYIRRRDGTNLINGKSGTITDAANGKVEYDWAAEETDEAGVFRYEWEIVYSDGETERVPNDDYKTLEIEESY